jgi:hypothetical protein
VAASVATESVKLGLCARFSRGYTSCDGRGSPEPGLSPMAAKISRTHSVEFRPIVESSKPASRVYRVVLTGGPCAGKTTALARLTERLEDFGFKVFRVPEAATLLQNGGLSFAGLRQEQVIDMQAHLMRVQFSLEEEFDGIARATTRFSDAPSVLLCDRGLMDGRAYVSEEMFRQVILASRVDESLEKVVLAVEAEEQAKFSHALGLAALPSSPVPSPPLEEEDTHHVGVPFHSTPIACRRVHHRDRLSTHPQVSRALEAAEERMRNERYDVVMHLVTAADGAVEHYTTANNATRSETAEQAIAVDQAIRSAWLGSPVHRVIGNAGIRGFEEKMDRAVSALCQKLAVPLPGASKKYWVLRCKSINEWAPPLGMEVREFALIHTYLPADAGTWGAVKDHGTEAIGSTVRLTLRRKVELGYPTRTPVDASTPAVIESAIGVFSRGDEDESTPSDDDDARSTAKDIADNLGIPLGSDLLPLTLTPSGLNLSGITFQLRARRQVGTTADGKPEFQESVRMLSRKDYELLIAQRRPSGASVMKRRKIMVHASRAFELDEVLSPPMFRGLCMLSTEVEDASLPVELPDGFTEDPKALEGCVGLQPILAVDVTGDATFLTSSLAKGPGPAPGRWGPIDPKSE